LLFAGAVRGSTSRQCSISPTARSAHVSTGHRSSASRSPRGLAAGNVAACAKHFPGLGTLRVSTDDRPYVRGHLRDADLAPYRAAVEADVPCVMVSHGVYPSLGARRAVLEPSTYRLLRSSLGFQGITITDSLSVVHGRAAKWAVGAVRAGADLLLFTDPADAQRAIRALMPLARRGELDAHVARFLRFRQRLTDQSIKLL
jgi:beta-N-acetylhexosaminidase